MTAATLAISYSAIAEVLLDQDFRTVIHTAGANVWPTVSGNNRSGAINNAFDGVRFSSDSNKRWLSSFKDFGVFGVEGKEGVYAQMLAPKAFLGRIYLKKYRFYLLSCGGNEAARAPKSWKVFGVPANANGSADWTGLDSQSDYTSWEKPTVETANEFEIDEKKIAGNGFRAFRFVPLDSAARTWSSTNPDFGLMEIEFVVDVYRNVTIETELADAFRQQGDYSPAPGTAFDGVTTLTAPKCAEKNGKTYILTGHRIDEMQNGRWKTVATVEDGNNSFDYEPAEDPNTVRRVVWLWRESAIPIDMGPVEMVSLFADRGKVLQDYVYGGNKYSGSRLACLFDGILGGTDSGDRWLGIGDLSQLKCYGGVKNLSSVLMSGDLFYVKSYALYRLSTGGNEKSRAPTAWKLTVSSDGGTFESIDERLNVDWSNTTATDNAYEFTPQHPEVGFTDIRFTPTASSVTDPGTSGITVGLMELRLNVNMANPPGTLRVYNGNDVLDTGFSVANKTLLSEAATVTAPEFAIGASGAKRYAVTGYRLEKFNLAETAWELVEKVEDGTRTYSFTPDADVGYRLVWTHDAGEVNPWQLTVNSKGEKCIRNGNWEFVVTEADDGMLTLANKGYRTGSGELDLDVRILDGDGQEQTIAAIGDRVIDGENDSSLRKLLTTLVLPKSVRTIGKRPFRNMTALKRIEMRCPELISLGECAFTRDTALDTLLIDAPKLTKFLYGYTFWNAPLAATDVADWNLSALESLPMDAFHCDDDFSAGLTARSCGVLTLPKLRSVGANAFQNHRAFSGLRLGTEDCKLVSIGAKAFANMAITNLVLGSRYSLAVAADACQGINGGAGVGTLVFLGNAPADRTAVDSLLAGHGPENLATLKVSKDFPGWNAYVTPVDAIDDDDVKAAAVDAGAVGAWRLDSGDYCALVWRISTGFRSYGTAVIIR